MKFVVKAISSALIASQVLAVTSADGKCRALVLSGGGNNGVWEAGVLYGLTHFGDPADYTWDVTSGVSAGGINAGMTAVWPKGSEVEMTEWMADQYAGLSTSDIFTVREGNPYELFFKEPSLLNSDPALATIQRILGTTGGSIERNFVASAMDVNLGEYVPQTQENTSFEQLPLAMLSSGSIPAVFQPRDTGAHLFMDGGTAWNVNLDSAVQECLKLVENQEDIIVDLLVTRMYTQPEPVVEKSAIKNWQSARSIQKYYDNFNSVKAQGRAYPDIEFRYTFMEARGSCPGSELNFNNDTTWCLQMQGRADAKAMLEIGQEGIGMSLEEWDQNKALQKEYPVFRNYLDFVYNLF